MKRFIYPAILFKVKGEDQFAISIYDLGIVTVGDTMEDAFNDAKITFQRFIKVAMIMDADIPMPSKFEEVVLKYPNHNCFLIEVDFNEKNEAV